MRVGIIGTGAISHKHALAYRNIGFRITVCTDINPVSGQNFAAQNGATSGVGGVVSGTSESGAAAVGRPVANDGMKSIYFGH